MDRRRCSANLGKLCQGLEDYAKANPSGIPSDPSGCAERLSDSLYLAHSTSDANFTRICASGYLVSASRRAASRGRALPPQRTEVLMGTDGSVFFYVSPFRYPNTGSGLLFAGSLELQHQNDGLATPFDSGGLLRIFTLPNSAESPQEFLARHEMPIPEHRRYLRMSMGQLFHKAEDYVEGLQPHRPGPIGLTGGDYRRWTHEVRIPDRVLVRSTHLQAAFAPLARTARDPEIRRFFGWCAGKGVDHIAFDTPRGREFETLQKTCLDYVRRLY
ncbi:hypothetical protein SBA4_870027 [Candidatus Sulfopaludibacter sp. SbA4]|nr:hypothetical protein SBA4_870027 [Candidatus Sulfopaludibacter sp. SbA4]